MKPIRLSLVPEFTPTTPSEMTAMFEASSCLGPRGPVAHEEQSRIF